MERIAKAVLTPDGCFASVLLAAARLRRTAGRVELLTGIESASSRPVR